ncbi:MAG: hypothetical protein U5J96_09250 [Ignavibacteriaceae bacterium]|nr:hypothetical protein [Ignavibacteriaceae bacterium]
MKTLVNEEKPTGEYEMNNAQITSGIYFYQLRQEIIRKKSIINR